MVGTFVKRAINILADQVKVAKAGRIGQHIIAASRIFGQLLCEVRRSILQT